MKLLRKLGLGAICLALGGGAALAHGVVRFDNGRWYDGSGFRERTVFSVDGRLVFRHDGPVDRTVDLRSGFVVPPFGDAHNHGLAGNDFTREQASFLAAGVFYVANPNCVGDLAMKAAVEAASPETVDVIYAMGGLTSTGGHPVQIYDALADQVDGWTRESMNGRAYWTVDDRAAIERLWPRLLATEPDYVKLYLERSELHAARRADAEFYGKRGLDPALVPEIVQRAHAAGLRVAAHVTSIADFLVAVRSGVDEIAHLPLERLSHEDAAAAARQGTVVVTTTLSHRPTPGIDDLDALHAHNLTLLRRHGVRIVLGTDSHRSVLDEADHVARLAGLTSAETLRLLAVETPRWVFPDRDLGILEPGREASFLVLGSDPRVDAGALRDIGLLVKQGHVLEVADREALRSPTGPLAHRVMSEGVAAAIAEYHRLRREETDTWDFSEQVLNSLGYFLLGHNRVDDAIAIFRLNVEQFPDAANPWDSLGEAYMKRGDTEQAIAHYRRSLELDPNNEGAREKLRELEGR